MKGEKRDLSRTFKKGMGRIQKGAGFTLIELMVVVVIIGILAAVALPRFMVNQRKAKEGAAWADMDAMTTAMEMFYLDCDEYPDGAEGKAIPAGSDGLLYLQSGTQSGWAGPYMKYRRSGTLGPQDPWANYYHYEADSTTAAKNYTIWSLGGVYDTTTYSAYYINKGWFKSP